MTDQPNLTDETGLEEVYEDSVRLLDRWRTRYEGRPAEELWHLWLLALEREQLVSVAYRDSAIAERIKRMPLDPLARHVLRRACIWMWQDEEMHAAYVRGLLIKDTSGWKRAVAYGRQLFGAVSGWASSADQHLHLTDKPLAVLSARAMTLGGLITGQVSKTLRRELTYGPFRRFCRMNVELERSAELCWARIVDASLTEEDRDAALQVRDDETNHTRVFSVLEQVLGDDDRLRSGLTTTDVIERLRPIGEWFLPREFRDQAQRPGDFASGAPVFVKRGDLLDDKRTILRSILDELGLPEAVASRRDSQQGPLRTAIKTAFMLGYHRDDRSTIADSVLVEELAKYLRDLGVDDVAVLEAPTVYDRFYGHRSVAEVAEYFGFSSPLYRIVDCSDDQEPFVFARGMAQSSISSTWRDADLRLVFAKLRTNPSEAGHLCLSSLEGLGQRQDAYVFASRQLHYRMATMMVIDQFEPDFGLVDGYENSAQGPFGVMGCRHPISPRRIYGGRDALAVDCVVLRDLGIPDPLMSPMIRTATYWFDGPDEPDEVHGDVGPIPGFRHPYCDTLSTLVSTMAYPVYVYGSGGGNLFMPQMDEQAFPPLARVNPVVRGVRRTTQLAFGLRPPAKSSPPTAYVRRP